MSNTNRNANENQGRTHAPLWAFERVEGKDIAAPPYPEGFAGGPIEQYDTHIERQGRLFAVARKRRHDAPRLAHNPTLNRRAIKGFSKASSRRMLKKMARLRKEHYHAHFVTLTYAHDMRDAAAAKAHLRAFYKRIKYYYNDVALLWRMEFQQRGAIHFHCILFNIKYIKYNEQGNSSALQQMWNGVTGEIENNSLDASYIKSHRGVMHYVSKYVAKRGDNGFIPLPYLAKALLSIAHKLTPLTLAMTIATLEKMSPVLNPGRFWGVLGERDMPYGELSYTIVRTELTTKAHKHLKRAVRRWTRGALKMSSKRDSGVVLFTEHAEQWGRYASYLLTTRLSC